MQPHPLVEDQVDGLHAVPVDGVFARRSQGVEPDSVLAGRQRLERLLRLQVGGPLVQEGVVAGCADVLDNSPGQPQQVVRSVRSPDESGPPVLQAMEPVDDVALGKLLGGVQRDLLPRHGGVHPDQVDRVLKLIAKTVRPAGLIEPAPGPDALGQGLVFQPVQVTIELRLIGLNLERIHQAEPPPPGVFQGGAGCANILVLGDDRFGFLPVIGLPQDHDQSVLTVRGDFQSGEQRRDRPVVQNRPGVRLAAFDKEWMSHAPAGSEEAAAARFHDQRPLRESRESRSRAVRVARVVEEERGK